MLATTTLRLAKVRVTIDRVLDLGQALDDEGQRWTLANLDSLRRLEASLVNQLAAETRTSRNRVRYVIPRT